MATLNVPAPLLESEPAGPAAQLEKPVNIKLGALVYADGQTASADELKKAGAFVYRVAGAGAAEEVWNEDEQAWQPALTDLAALASMTPLPLTHKDGEASPWQGVLVAIGQKDKDGAPRYAAAVNGMPVYRTRALAQFTHEGALHEGLSAPSTDLRFVSASENQRFKISFDTETAADATRARIQLRDSALKASGFIELRAAGREVEIAACDSGGNARARVLLNSAGDIELRPAPGRRVIVMSDLEAEHIRYLPTGGAIKQDL